MKIKKTSLLKLKGMSLIPIFNEPTSAYDLVRVELAKGFTKTKKNKTKNCGGGYEIDRVRFRLDFGVALFS